uniref:Aminodeoxychorismate lyase n=1 Tax=Rheinheimera sp. BAL341 TaxID=1708203 RepID=A0A486XHY6_9GAMM
MAPGISDRSFNYGDGVFTTMLVCDGQLQLWPLHLSRLQVAANRLGFGPVDWEKLQHDVFTTISSAHQVIKLLLSRGEGGRGYSPAGITQPHWYISQSAVPDYAVAAEQGISVETAELKLAVQPLLAGLKHNNRLEQVLLKQEQSRRGVDDLLVLDQLGYVTEAISANVFFYRNGQWATPKLHRAGVAGVMREALLARHKIAQHDWQYETLMPIDAMFICNAIMGVIPVKLFDGRPLDISPVLQFRRQMTC